MKYLESMREIFLPGKIRLKSGNNIGDEGCKAFFSKSKYLPNIQKIHLRSKYYILL